MEKTAESIRTLVGQINVLLDGADGYALSNQAAKLAIQLEQLLEHKSVAKRRAYVSYANSYEHYRDTHSQGDAKIYADAKKDMEYETIASIESGVKSVLSTVKIHLDWLQLESQNKKL
jgi:hypothetical protein